MLEPQLDNAARFRLLQTQYELAKERADLLAQKLAEKEAAASPAAGQPLLNRFILEMLYEIRAEIGESVYYNWRIDSLNPVELRESLLQESGGRPYIVLYTDTKELRYSSADAPPPIDPNEFR